MSKPIPILVGAGQFVNRSKSLNAFMHPIEMMTKAVVAACEDAEAASLAAKADAIHVVNVLSWNHRNFPVVLADALDAKPVTLEYTSVGGNSPQWLVNRVADNIAAGASQIAVLVGCEVMNSVSMGMKAGKDLGSFRDKVEITLTGLDRPGTHKIENDHFADRPVRIYPLIENALRFKEGITIEEQKRRLGHFAETFSSVAAKNPFAWFPVARTAEEAVTPGPKNRMISFPYPKYLNAVMSVDQSAAVIMTSTEKAKALGIPESKWVYVHGGQDANDHWYLSERTDIAESVAIQRIVQDALFQAEICLDEINFFDLYSCFPCMPRMTCRILGIEENDPRPLTITGGLPYFGGAGNNYVMHSIAEAMNLCRADRSKLGMITSNGYYSTKHGVGIYGGEPPKKPWARMPPKEFQENLPLAPKMEIETEPTGEFLVDSYTVWHDREGEPEVGILIGRTAAGKRAWAQTRREDKDLMRAMMAEEWIGKKGKLAEKKGHVNVAEF